MSIKEPSPSLLTQSFIMLGGLITRYLTYPTLHGKGFSQDLVNLAGPTLL